MIDMYLIERLIMLQNVLLVAFTIMSAGAGLVVIGWLSDEITEYWFKQHIRAICICMVVYAVVVILLFLIPSEEWLTLYLEANKT